MDVKVTYRRTSRLSLRIDKKCGVRVSAPIGTPRDKILAFIEEHRQWIADARKRQAVALNKRHAFFSQLPLSTAEDKQAVLERMHILIPPLVEKYAPIVGTSPRRITYSATISRWGCCKPATKELNFSVYLLLLPEWCIESIVAHEMAHFREANHSKAFYAWWEKLYPRWKEARKEIARIQREKGEEPIN